MKLKRLIMYLVILLVLTCLPAALAQTPAPNVPQAPVLSTRTTLVLVPALVRTKDGAPVFTLIAKDFVLTDDGIEQKITIDEETGSEPLALVVAVETEGAEFASSKNIVIWAHRSRRSSAGSPTRSRWWSSIAKPG